MLAMDAIACRVSVRAVALLLSVLPVIRSAGEDADRFRPYLRFHSGDLNPLWGVDDLWSFGFGANFDRRLGVELSLDFFERDSTLSPFGKLGEVSAWNVVPQVRLRFPAAGDRLVPYFVGGVGPSFLQFNDRKEGAFGLDIDIEGMTVATSAGAGLEYFIADNVTFGIEGKYLWVNPIEGEVDGRALDVDVSSAVLTFGLRVYFDENRPRPMPTQEPVYPGRFFFGVRLGGSIQTDAGWGSGVRLEPEVSAWGRTLNQTGGLMLGADFGRSVGVELAADIVEHSIDLKGRGTIGEYSTGFIVPQLRLRWPQARGRWVPYLSTGMGLAYAEFNDLKENGQGLRVDAKGVYPAVTVGGGIEYFVTRNFSLNADARWAYTWGHDLGIENALRTSGDFAVCLLNVGFRVYLFDLWR